MVQKWPRKVKNPSNFKFVRQMTGFYFSAKPLSAPPNSIYFWDYLVLFCSYDYLQQNGDAASEQNRTGKQNFGVENSIKITVLTQRTTLELLLFEPL